MKAAVWWLLCASTLQAVEPVRVVFERAAQALAASDYQGAESGFKAVLRTEPRNIAALGNLGIIYSRTNRADDAIATYRRALQLAPDDKVLLVNLGLVYLRQERHTQALPLFARAVKLDPQHLQARQLLAVCRAYTGQPGPAIRDLESLRAATPGDGDLLFLLGFAYLKNAEPEKARVIFGQMFEAVGPARAEFLIGKANYEAALFGKAEESFRRALQLDPRFPGIHLELGKLFISQRQTEEAIRELQLVLKEEPENPDASYFLGGVLAQAGRFAEAIPYLERARSAKPDFWAPYLYLGKARLGLDHPSEAVPLLQRAVKLNPDDAAAYSVLARALQSCGRAEEARDALRRMRELRAAATAGPADDRVAGAR